MPETSMTDSDTAAAAPAATSGGAEAAPKPRRRRFAWVLVAMALIVVAVLALGGLVVWPHLAALQDDSQGGPSPEQLAARIDSLSGEVSALRQRVAQLEDRSRQLQSQAQLNTPSGQAEALRPVAVPPPPAPSLPAHLEEDVKAQAERLAQLEKNTADAASVLKLSGRIDSVEGSVRALEQRRSSAGALLLAVGQLRQAVDAARPYDAELRSLEALAAGNLDLDHGLADLRPRATQGVPARAGLAANFHALEPAIIRADMVPASGWVRRTLDRLGGLMTIRREDGEAAGTSAAAVAARAGAKLDQGDLAAAVAEVGQLTGGPAEVAAPWLAEARARLAADQSLSALTAQVVASAGAGH